MQKKLWLILLYSAALSAKDLGTFGETFPIVEENLLSFIQGKLIQLQSAGELEKHQKTIVDRVVKGIERPVAVEGIIKTRNARKIYYDPSITVPYDLKDHKGRVFHKAGTIINPLETHQLKRPLFIIDGDDLEQVNWAKNQKSLDPKIILVKGSPFNLIKTHNITVFFDQGGSIVKKLGIKQIPARVDQEGKKLVISEILLEEEQ